MARRGVDWELARRLCKLEHYGRVRAAITMGACGSGLEEAVIFAVDMERSLARAPDRRRLNLLLLRYGMGLTVGQCAARVGLSERMTHYLLRRAEDELVNYGREDGH